MNRRLELYALPAMPGGFALWLLGASAESFGISLAGLLLLISGAVSWNQRD